MTDDPGRKGRPALTVRRGAVVAVLLGVFVVAALGAIAGRGVPGVLRRRLGRPRNE